MVAGDAEEPAGKFEDTSGLLAAMADLGHGLEEVGITGYPESHPFISDADTIKAMYEKEPYSTYIVSQICFDTQLIADWVRRVRRRGVELPIYVGIPGAVSRQRLMRISRSIGLGESARFLKRYSNWFFAVLLARGLQPRPPCRGPDPIARGPSR